jgi:hypothetical protein
VAGADCTGTSIEKGGQNLLELQDKSFATYARMSVNVDGSGRAYHPDGYAAGAIIHLCNAGQVHLPDGTRFHGSESNSTCTGKFMDSVKEIEAAGWDDPSVGAIRWYGILGVGSTRIAGKIVNGVMPVKLNDGSGFFVSPTALADTRFSENDQRRYVDALTVPHAAVRSNSGIELGTMGVAWRVKGCRSGRSCEPVPFIVGDIGPKTGEGSVYLTRAINGLSVDEPITRKNRYSGHVDDSDVLYVFFRGSKLEAPYESERVMDAASQAFGDWGGSERLKECATANIPDANN